MQTKREALLAMYKHQQPDFIVSETTACQGVIMPGDRYFGPDPEGFDWFGVKWTQLGPDPGLDGSIPTPGYTRLDSISNWQENLKLPELDETLLAGIFTGASQQLDANQHVIKGLFLSGNFERMNQLTGMEEAMCAFYEDPDAVHSFFEAMTEYKIACIDMMTRYVKLDVIEMHDDWGMSTNMLFSPDIWREFIRPCEKRLAAHIHNKGIIYEHHSCGYITPIIPDLVEIGIDALNPLNPCNDLEYIKREFGSVLTICGGVDNLLLDHKDIDEQIIREEARRAMDAYGHGGSYIPMFTYTDARIRDIFVREVDQYGETFYSSSH